jgi:hypothetical protein
VVTGLSRATFASFVTDGVNEEREQVADRLNRHELIERQSDPYALLDLESDELDLEGCHGEVVPQMLPPAGYRPIVTAKVGEHSPHGSF